MPQLVPFYFTNLLTFGMLAISMLLYLVSTIILPNILRLLVARTTMTKL
ncbi:ATPase subunit 8 (mitochondrion) [Debaryomyces hansenii]|uniref:ATP synthase protein 8 n=1 Tax=Debaryomyces hansenii (strain ATCC 36239 / CBS 767 / BCRC 21394 / JCM 1990 / NBRC 0083 / IGC 2968) TaxID=284592 RepID=ATP8_DEBHA|nr:ATPase subunit 8 [Debaryomyces hansenii]A9RAH3.1 RecName: Full=ATP synthase protein 8; AltName: Full=A6L; AltName: Full=F-ATPase subunit 8 [Debaryomyces hansenii CBS767]ABF58074.1 ATPase subunit 8 [Debaryomyces hansenii]|eukprot:YP_001621425.1 ATPase subunit 8 (mitochondrion) [Debaryomyces hansenii]